MDDLTRRVYTSEEQKQRFRHREQEDTRLIGELAPLPLRRVPQSCEDLASLLSRCSRKMGYEHPKWLLRPESASHKINVANLPLLHRAKDYFFLERLLLLEEGQIYALTLHQFAFRFTQNPSPLTEMDQKEPVSISRPGIHHEHAHQFFFTGPSSQVCPHCLEEEDGYDRLYWRCNLLLYCPRHQVFLIRSCPSCRAPIPALRPSLTHCPECKIGDYRTASFPLLSEDHWLVPSHVTLLRHLGVDEVEMPPLAIGNSVLDGLSSWDYFRILTTCSSFLQPISLAGEDIFHVFMGTLPLEIISQRLSKRIRIHPSVLLPSLLTHYLCSAWPFHILTYLACLGRILQEGFRYSRKTKLVRTWSHTIVQRNFWCVQAYLDRPADHLENFARFYKETFEFLPTAEEAQDRHGGVIVNERILMEKESHITPLDKSIRPYRWESLTSLLARVANAMGYRRTEGVCRAVSNKLSLIPEKALLMKHDSDYQVFKELLFLDVGTLHALTLHRFASSLQAPLPEASSFRENALWDEAERPLLTIETSERYCLPLQTTKVCSACLREEPVFERLYWNIRSVLICPRHRLFLISQCPNCSWLIPSLRRTALYECPYCLHGDYRTAKSMEIPQNSLLFLSQRVLFQKLAIDELDTQDFPAFFHDSPIETLQSWQYFDLLYHFGAISSILRPDRFLPSITSTFKKAGELAYAQQSKTRGLERQVSLFHALFLSWPDMLQTIFSETFPSSPGMQQELDNLSRGTSYEKAFAQLRDLFFETQNTYWQQALLRSSQLANAITGKLIQYMATAAENPAGPQAV